MSKILEKKVEVLSEELKKSKSAIEEFKETNKELADTIAEMQKQGLSTDEIVKSINDEFAKKIKSAKNKEELIGKSFFVNTKDAKLGTNTFEVNDQTVGADKYNAFDVLASWFGVTNVDGNLVNHAYHQGRSEITVDGTPVPECTPAPECDYTYDNAKFAVEKYACCLPTSVEFGAFVKGGADNAINSSIINLNNQFTKYSLHASDEPNNRYGLFNEISGRDLVRSEVETSGIVTIGDLLSLRHKANSSIALTGAYFMPQSVLEQIELEKDNNGNYKFMPNVSIGTSIQGFAGVGTLAGRPVYVVPDDIWFQTGTDVTTASNELAVFASEEAFQ